MSQLSATPYNLTNAPNTTVTYEAKQAANSTSANSIIRSLGNTGNPTDGILSDATLTLFSGSGVAFDNELNDNGADGNYDYLTQGGSTSNSALDLTFVAPAGQKFSAGDLDLSMTVLQGNFGLWPVGSYMEWQISKDGGAFATVFHRDNSEGGASRSNNFAVISSLINGGTSIVLRGTVVIAAGGITSRSHWHLLDTAPWTDGGDPGGLTLNLTTVPVPEPASLVLAAAGTIVLVRVARRRPAATHP